MAKMNAYKVRIPGNKHVQVNADHFVVCEDGHLLFYRNRDGQLAADPVVAYAPGQWEHVGLVHGDLKNGSE